MKESSLLGLVWNCKMISPSLLMFIAAKEGGGSGCAG